ncbi:MAG: hypothetical protein LBP76_05485, partial [Treponema sp.]|nr:hypothetical protein [Treponema sp.]
MESSHSRFYGVFPFFLLFIPVFFILGCDLFNHSMVDYFLDNTEVVEVSGIGGRSEYAVMSNGIILIPPASSDEPVSILEAALSNPQNIAVRYQLLGAPSEKNITIRQAGSTKMELVIEGAELDDEFDLTLVMQSADGLRDFASYNMRIRCVSFDTGLSGFRVNEIHPVFDQGSFTVKLPYETEEVTLEGIALEPAASLKLFRGQDAAGTLIASASHKVAGTVHLEVGNNFFYLEVRMSGAVQGYAINVIRMQDSKKLITEFYLTVNSKHYGVGSGVEPGSGSIDGADIAVTVPYETALTSLAPVVVVSGGASSNPASGAARNFTSSQTYTVTAEDGTTQDYTVTVNVAKIASVTAVTGNLTSPNGFKKTGSDISAAIKAAITSVTGTDSLGTAIILAEADYSVDPLTPATAGGNVTATLRVPSAKTSSGTDIITNFPVYIKNDAKAITEFYFTVNSTNYGVGS